MALMNVTCPESAHLETIDIERTPRGLRIVRCSVFGDCPVSCPHTCAARLERKLGERKQHETGTVLVARSCLGRE